MNEKVVMNTNNSLAPKVFKGGFWVLFLRIINRLFEFIRTVVLARLLAPQDFGLFGIALLSLSILQRFTQTGFGAALIQKKENIKPYLDTVWTLDILRNTVLALILFIAAPLVGIFFNEPKAILLVKILSITVFLGGLANIGTIYFRKEIEFHKLAKLQLCTSITDMVVAITAAIYLRNVWALVYGLIAARIVGIFVSYKIHPYRPHIKIDWHKAKELFNFGKWVMGSSILLFILTQGDDIFVGKFLGVAALGFYQMAYRLSNMPATEITHLISQVTFPAYSKMQDNLPRLRESYLRVLQLTAFLSFPIAGLIFVLAPDFTKIFLGKRWLPIIPAMQALAIFGVIRAINATTGSFFQGLGKPKINTIGSIFQLLVFIVIVYPLTKKWNILGTSISVIIPNMLFMMYIINRLAKEINYGSLKFIYIMLPPIVCTVISCGIIYIGRIRYSTSLLSFFVFIAVGISSYLLLLYIIDRYSNYGIKKNILQSV